MFHFASQNRFSNIRINKMSRVYRNFPIFVLWCLLFKVVHIWTILGLGSADGYYLRLIVFESGWWRNMSHRKPCSIARRISILITCKFFPTFLVSPLITSHLGPRMWWREVNYIVLSVLEQVCKTYSTEPSSGLV